MYCKKELRMVLGTLIKIIMYTK